jgi:hypothetical protein
MTRRNRLRLAAMVAVLAIIALAFVALAVWPRSPGQLPPRRPNERPPLMLATSLPLVFGETLSLEGNGSPALTALETRYWILPIGITDAASLRAAPLLLMAHANAQPADALVDLDRWVRDGGHVLLLADPRLEWPSERPLGDALRPSPMFTDTGLLGHWGLKLSAPDQRGPAKRRLGGRTILTDSPGRLSGGCKISADALVAHCRIGKGAATVVADADFLNVEALGPGAKPNLDALLAELASLEASPGDSPSRSTSTGLSTGS